MTGYGAVTAVNVSICAAIGIACYATGSGLPLFALLFLMELKHKRVKADQKGEVE